jgi:hypothetical protein
VEQGDMGSVTHGRLSKWASGFKVGPLQVQQAPERWHLIQNLSNLLDNLVIRFN